jgi:sterol desaturase/sphingolipid hydroxylase (fatty acid hydroxylase superfamily)
MSFSIFVQALWHRIGPAECALIAFIWIMTLLGAGYAFLREDYHREPRTLRGFVRFLLPPGMIRDRQIRLDIAFVIAKKLTRCAWGWAFVGNFMVAYVVHRGLTLLAPDRAPFPHGPGLGEQALFFVGTIAAQDFMNFLGHFLMHKVPVLWSFHKVHHSATVLTPITGHRIHPVQEISDCLFFSLGGGTVIALYSWLTACPLVDSTFLGVQAYFVMTCLTFYQLRHSHIHLRYPRWLERALMSPAQHQIHHSRETRHLDRNFGVMFACWDQLFGTIIYTDPSPVTKFGLVEDQAAYESVWKLYAMPIMELGQKLFSAPRGVDATYYPDRG